MKQVLWVRVDGVGNKQEQQEACTLDDETREDNLLPWAYQAGYTQDGQESSKALDCQHKIILFQIVIKLSLHRPAYG
jgi:hypothetical protein